MSMTPYAGGQLSATNGTVVAPVPAEPAGQAPAVAQLVEWAHGAVAAREVAVSLVGTSFCPTHYRGKPDEATAAILAGLEVGLQPMAALQAFVPIQGSAAAKAVTLRAIVQSRGHDIWIEESTATRAVVGGRRKGSAQVQRSEWTIERAAQMKLTTRDQWKLQPTAMLIARATSECARMIASDAILGIPYSVEELQDGMGSPVQAVAEQVAPPAAAPSRRRNPTSMLPPAPAVSESEPVGEAPGSTRLDPKGEVMARLVGLLTGPGFPDRDAALVFVGEVVGRTVHHPKDLTHAEARRVIDRLLEREVERTVGPPEVDADDTAGGGS